MKEWKEPSKYSQWSSQVGVLHGFNRKRGEDVTGSAVRFSSPLTKVSAHSEK